MRRINEVLRLIAASMVCAVLGAAPAQECARCHAKEVAAFLASPMGRSAGRPDERPVGEVSDPRAQTNVKVSSRDGVMYQTLERGKLNASYALTWQVGAGIVGYTYLIALGPYLLQSPLSFYVNNNAWDLTPGYEAETALDVDHPIVSGCLFCHAGTVRLEAGAENRYEKDAIEAISCERCHGPAERHLKRPVAGTILNPARLADRARDSVCEQCHLEGLTRVLNPGKDWWDFHPGDNLEDVFVTYVQDMSSQKEVPAVSQAEELAASRCARASGGRLWCGTCHDPHGEAGSDVARVTAVCMSCHGALFEAARHKPAPECVSCHMPRIRPTNVSHAAITDHRIVRTEAAPANAASGEGDVEVRAWHAAPAPVAARDEGLALFDVGAAEHGRGGSALVGRSYDLLRQAARRDAGDPRVLATLGSILLENSFPNQAEALFAQASTRDARNPQLAYDLAVALERMGNRAGAIRELRRSIALDASFASGYRKLAEIYAAQGMEGLRRQTIQAYLRVMPQSIGFRLMLDGPGTAPSNP